MKFTNNHNIPLPLAVWLLHDTYDYNDDPRYISATTLIKPIKQIVLKHRVPKGIRELDLSDLLASRRGTAIHDSIEMAWKNNLEPALKKLGYDQKIIDCFLVNPTDEEVKANPHAVAVYMEKRTIREINGWKVGGKFDMVIDGRLFDIKTTSVWAILKGDKDKKYSEQGSIYRWLAPEIITSDHVYIQFLFSDWQRAMSKTNPDYPKIPAAEHVVPLISLRKTEKFIADKLAQIEELWNEDEEYIPECTAEDLWMQPPSYKYYANPENLTRSTKNFTTLEEANSFMASKGGKGVVKEILGEAKACEYCDVFEVCKQKDRYLNV